MASKPTERLKALFLQYPELSQELCAELVSLYDRKLWHELSLRLREVFKDPAYMPYIQPLFKDFIVDFGQKMNLIYFAQFAHDVAKTMDRDAAVDLLRMHSASIKELKGHPIQEPLLFMEMSIAEHFIDVSHMDECKELLDKGLKQLEGMSDVRSSHVLSLHGLPFHEQRVFWPLKQDQLSCAPGLRCSTCGVRPLVRHCKL
jgi:hypothetical protein